MKESTNIAFHKNTALVIAALALLAGLIALLIPLTALERVLLLFSTDGNIQSKTLIWVKGLLLKGAPLAILSATAAAAYAMLGSSLSERPKEPPSKTAPRHPVNMYDALFLLLILAIATVIRWPLMLRSLSFDEILTCVRHLLPNHSAPLIDYYMANHIGCTVLAWLSSRFFGFSEWGLRLPSLLLGLFTIAITWAWIRNTLGARAAILSALFLALSPIHAIFSASMRGYYGVVLFSVISMMLFTECLERPTTKKSLLLFAANIIGSLFHLFFLILVIAQTISLAAFTLSRKGERAVPPGALSLWKIQGVTILATVLGYLPKALSPYFETPPGPKFTIPATLNLDVLKDLLGASLPTAIIASVLIVLGLQQLRKTGLKYMATASSLLILLSFASPWTLPQGYLYARFWAALLPLALICLATGLIVLFDSLRQRSLPLAILAIIFPCALIFKGWISDEYSIPRDHSTPFREICERAREKADKETVFFAIGHGDGLFSFYFKDRPIKTIEYEWDYRKFLKEHPKAACFVLPDIDQSPKVDAMLRDVRQRAHEERIKDIAVYFFTP